MSKNHKKRGGYSLKIKYKKSSSKKSRSKHANKTKRRSPTVVSNRMPSIGVTNRTFLEIFK